MNLNAIKNRLERSHKKWLGNILSLNSSDNAGIDLSDEKIGIELKSRYRVYGNRYTVHHYQIREFMHQNKNKELFWAFLLYDLSKTPSKLSLKKVEESIISREVWIFPWSFVEGLEINYPKTGPYIYVDGKSFENYKKTQFTTKDSKIYLPKGSILEDRLK